MQTRVGYAGGLKENPEYYALGEHAEAVRVIYDPARVSLEEILREFRLKARGGIGYGQYRSEVFPLSDAQAAAVRPLVGSVPLAEPGSARARFWDAEDYHQKYRVRRSAELVRALERALGPRWDQHVWATKLNAAGVRGFKLEPWLEELPSALRETYRKHRTF